MEEKKTEEAVKEIAKEVYNDGCKPAVKAVGETLGLIPRAIRAALLPVEKWILNREYNLAETKKLLAAKLQDTPPEQIETPEPYIAVPVCEAISYCMNNKELRDMYANLLANSMNKVVKDGVHPGFVEIIKQLSPDEAKILKYFYSNPIIPIITLRAEDKANSGLDILSNYSNIEKKVPCEQPLLIGVCFDNLIRLGMIHRESDRFLTDEAHYEALKQDPYVKKSMEDIKKQEQYNNPRIKKGYIELTAFGKKFCKICLDYPRSNVTTTVLSVEYIG